MASRPSRGQPSSASSSPPPPPPSGRRRVTIDQGNQRNGRNQNNNRRSFMSDKDFHRGSDITVILTVYGGESSGWRSVPYTFRPIRTTDEELWLGIRETYRNQLETPWRRFFGFKKVRQVLPVEFSRNDVPKTHDSKTVPGEHDFIHAYRHPLRLRTRHEWVEFFRTFKEKVGDNESIGLQFVEGIWAAKLALVSLVLTAGIIVGSVLWVVLGHAGLQTVFTVMSFILSGVAALIALLALYYQLDLPN